MYDTIAAISSGHVNQAISIIRIVGPESLNIIEKIFTGKIGKNKTIEYGYIKDLEGKIIDEVLVSFFIGTNNFVGENTIEINAHGGIVISQKILDLILAQGARLATPGEFTRRAYLNGKISLMKAEAINEMIHAKTSKQHEIAIHSFNNEKEKKITQFIKQLEFLIGLCEVNIDYPEYDDIPILENDEFNLKLNELLEQIKEIVQSSEANQVFINHITIAIVGNPNAGKSSLLNAILNEEKSIVTNIEGTTRDVVEQEVIFNNFILKFKDTAGIRNATNEIEKIGIEKSFNEIIKSDLIIHVIDATKGLNDFDHLILEKVQHQKYLQIWNKSDLIQTKEEGKIYISSLNKDLLALENELQKLLVDQSIKPTDLVYNSRQTACLKRCLNHLLDAQNAAKAQQTYDVIIHDLHQGWSALKEISGYADQEDLLDSIFKNFCLGK